MSERPAAVAGTWYPGQAEPLRAELDGHLRAVPVRAAAERLVALVSPHAGLRYSGPVAAHAYAELRGQTPRPVVLVGPSHRAAFPGAAVWARGAFATPLGPLAVDEDLAGALLARGGPLRDEPSPHRREHSLEMQLPFLRHLWPEAKLVPILMGHQGREEVEALAALLEEVLRGRDVLLLASSDLSHYHPAPEANLLDAVVVGDVEAFDPEGLMDHLEAFPHHACGGGPMVVVMKAARALGARRAEVLRYADSGDAGEGDKSHVVGYLAAAFRA